MTEVRIKDIDEHEIDTILAEDIDFEGTLTFKKPLMIKGKFKGEIKSTSSLHIGEKAFVEASTEAAIVSSKGSHKGNIVGHTRVELFSTARVEGDITTPDFVMESGCKFNGYCNMGGVPRKESAAHAHSPQPAAQPAPTPAHAPPPQTSQQQPQQAAPTPAAAPQQPPRPQGTPQNNAQNQQQKPGNASPGSGGQQR